MDIGEWELLVQALTASAEEDETTLPAGRVENAARKEPDRAVSAVTVQPRPRQTQSGGDSAAKTALKTAGMMTGIGPLVTGLVNLFGGGEDDPEAAPIPFSLPNSLNVDAGVNADGAIVSVGYSESGPARELIQSQAQPVQIHVNVQAMDSRSFVDHRDEIAKAVRDAMLHSHSLNDIVAEI